ncbi:amidohydrolase family protein [Luteimonas vadosa]|uniref:Amidohydrolase-related domain-containing protein n=1 Tax=Luteimonas vadosa TaxID=1165507 RepID=A0ABP9E4A5_9GAMM
MIKATKQAFGLVCLLCLAQGSEAAEIAVETQAPGVDHHQHLLSDAGAALLNAPELAAGVPDEVLTLLRAQESAWDDPTRLAPLFTEQGVWLDGVQGGAGWIQGREQAATRLSQTFASAYQILPVFWHRQGDAGHLAVLYSRGDGARRRNVGTGVLALERDPASGTWRMAMQAPRFPGPALEAPLDADALVALLDKAGIARAVVLSIAYWFQSPTYANADADTRTRAENAWTAEQVARHPQRLVGFCSVNPLRDEALAIVDACARDARFRGLKLHFASSQVDLGQAAHVEKVRAVFAVANAGGLALVVHTRTGDGYGARDARVVVNELLPAAPDVTIQIAHLWGGGAFSADALAVFAEAVSTGVPATRHLVFDLSDVAYGAGPAGQQALVARRIREIGLDRVFYGSDAAYLGHPGPADSWAYFRKEMPFTEAEFGGIAGNEAPYLRTARRVP